MTSYILTLHNSPWSSQSVLTACQYATAAIKSGKKVNALFLYQDAVLNVNNQLDIPSDELNGHQVLKKLHHDFGVKILFCVTAAEKRGINLDNTDSAFTLAGLAEFAELTTNTHKVIQFK